MSEMPNSTAHELSDADCIDLLIRHRTNPDVSYDDLAYMAGWIYDATVSAEDLETIDAGEARPEIGEQIDAILSGEAPKPSEEVSDHGEESDAASLPSDDEGTVSLAGDAPEEKGETAGAAGDTASRDESDDKAKLRAHYRKYQARQKRWYPDQEQLSFEQFIEALLRWENEYGEAWNLEAPDESDRETIDELESLLCAPPQSRIFSALITTESGKERSENQDDATVNTAAESTIAGDAQQNRKEPPGAEESPGAEDVPGALGADEKNGASKQKPEAEEEDAQPEAEEGSAQTEESGVPAYSSTAQEPVNEEPRAEDDPAPESSGLSSPDDGHEEAQETATEEAPNEGAPTEDDREASDPIPDPAPDAASAPSVEPPSSVEPPPENPAMPLRRAADSHLDDASVSASQDDAHAQPALDPATSSNQTPAEQTPAEQTSSERGSTDQSPHASSNPNAVTMPEGKNIVTELRARRNALDSSMGSIRESLKHYEHMREVIDEAISLLEDDSYEQMLRLAKQFRNIGVQDEAADDASNADKETSASGDGRSQRPFRVSTG